MCPCRIYKEPGFPQGGGSGPCWAGSPLPSAWQPWMMSTEGTVCVVLWAARLQCPGLFSVCSCRCFACPQQARSLGDVQGIQDITRSPASKGTESQLSSQLDLS